MSRSFATASLRGPGGRNARGGFYLAAVLLMLISAATILGGCREHSRGDPVNRYHYEHFISVASDRAHMSIQTYIGRSQWEVGFRREDLYDGDRDGKLSTPGLDRVIITDYVDIEDPPDEAVRRSGELRDYNALFQNVLKAFTRGEETFEIEDRIYEFRVLSENLAGGSDHALG
jgi:hypothetical protein